MYTADPNGTTYGFTDKSKHTANTPWKSDRKSIRGITDKTPTSDDPTKLLENYVIKRKCKDF
jgi:hypothetical protein